MPDTELSLPLWCAGVNLCDRTWQSHDLLRGAKGWAKADASGGSESAIVLKQTSYAYGPRARIHSPLTLLGSRRILSFFWRQHLDAR